MHNTREDLHVCLCATDIARFRDAHAKVSDGIVGWAEATLQSLKKSLSVKLLRRTTTGTANDIIIPALQVFSARYPDISLELGCSDRPVDLIDEGVDCALRAGILPDSCLIARRISVLNFVTCATPPSPPYVKQFGRPNHPRDLGSHRCVNFFSQKTGKVFDWYFVLGDEEISIPLPSNLIVNDSIAYVTPGLAGLGIIQMPTYSMEPYLASGAMELLLEDLEQPVIAGKCGISSESPLVEKGPSFS